MVTRFFYTISKIIQLNNYYIFYVFGEEDLGSLPFGKRIIISLYDSKLTVFFFLVLLNTKKSKKKKKSNGIKYESRFDTHSV